MDQSKASTLGLNLADVNTTLSVAWGSDYVNDFIDRGRVKRVYVQSDAGFRMHPGDLDHWYVRGSGGEMVPFSSFAAGRWSFGATRLERYNGMSALEIQGEAAPGVSSGDAMREIDRLVASLPAGFRHEWTGLSFEERLSGNQATALYAISVLVVFLCLAALYESWSIPFAVMLSVPVGIAGALAGAFLFGQTNDVYFKVGLLTTIGLAAKNAILIVEFALEREARGASLLEATLDAARQRLRPILMTSFAFILGVLPLALARGAGSGAQNAIGVGVLGGMIAATVLGIFFVPLLFVSVRRVFGGRRGRNERRAQQSEAPILLVHELLEIDAGNAEVGTDVGNLGGVLLRHQWAAGPCPSLFGHEGSITNFRACDEKRIGDRHAFQALLLPDQRLKMAHPKNFRDEAEFVGTGRREDRGVILDPFQHVVADGLTFEFALHLARRNQPALRYEFFQSIPDAPEHARVEVLQRSDGTRVEHIDHVSAP